MSEGNVSDAEGDGPHTSTSSSRWIPLASRPYFLQPDCSSISSADENDNEIDSIEPKECPQDPPSASNKDNEDEEGGQGDCHFLSGSGLTSSVEDQKDQEEVSPDDNLKASVVIKEILETDIPETLRLLDSLLARTSSNHSEEIDEEESRETNHEQEVQNPSSEEDKNKELEKIALQRALSFLDSLLTDTSSSSNDSQEVNQEEPQDLNANHEEVVQNPSSDTQGQRTLDRSTSTTSVEENNQNIRGCARPRQRPTPLEGQGQHSSSTTSNVNSNGTGGGGPSCPHLFSHGRSESESSSSADSLSFKFGDLLESGELSDVTFLVGEAESPFRAHKICLALSSPVFRRMFYGQLVDSTQVVSLPDCHPPAFSILLQVLYERERVELIEQLCTRGTLIDIGRPRSIEVDVPLLLSILYVSHKYEVGKVEEFCVSFLLKYLKEKSVLPHLMSVLRCANMLNLVDLIDECWKIIEKQTKAFLECSLDNIDHETLLNIVKDERIQIREVDLFTLLVRWAENECEREGVPASIDNKLRRLGELLRYVRYPLMSPAEFADAVAPTGLLPEEQVAKILIYICSSGEKKETLSVDCPTLPRVRENEGQIHNQSQNNRNLQSQAQSSATFNFHLNDLDRPSAQHPRILPVPRVRRHPDLITEVQVQPQPRHNMYSGSGGLTPEERQMLGMISASREDAVVEIPLRPRGPEPISQSVADFQTQTNRTSETLDRISSLINQLTLNHFSSDRYQPSRTNGNGTTESIERSFFGLSNHPSRLDRHIGSGIGGERTQGHGANLFGREGPATPLDSPNPYSSSRGNGRDGGEIAWSSPFSSGSSPGAIFGAGGNGEARGSSIFSGSTGPFSFGGGSGNPYSNANSSLPYRNDHPTPSSVGNSRGLRGLMEEFDWRQPSWNIDETIRGAGGPSRHSHNPRGNRHNRRSTRRHNNNNN